MTTATVNRFIGLLNEGFRGISAKVPLAEVEHLAMLIHHSMDHGKRAYHTSSHLFEMSEGMNPRQVLATLFHDLVYYQLDGGFPTLADDILKKVVSSDKDGLVLKAPEQGDSGLAICIGVFGFKPGQTLPLFGGMNEFLSAVLAARLLGSYIKPLDLMAIVGCIEATVPFRGKGADGRGPLERLADRVRETCLAQAIDYSPTDIETIATDAVVLANRDVSSFSDPDPATFLSTTWLLIEESNAPLRAVGIYSIQEYRTALGRMEKFLTTLNADHVFHQYNGTPSAAAFASLCEATRRNLDFAGRYLGAKLLGIGLVEALALESGGNCPVSMLLGDIRSRNGKPDRVEDFLPPARTSAEVDDQLLAVLEQGRTRPSSSDLTDSPLTAYVCRVLGREGSRRAMERAKRMFAGELSARDFLATLDQDLVAAVAGACAQLAPSRKDALLSLAKVH